MNDVIIKELLKLSDINDAKVLSNFFKTGPNQYGEGDKFLGVKVPKQRIIAKKYYKYISLAEIEKLIKNKYHEVRNIALIILVYKMEKATNDEQTEIYRFYLKITKYINNWDLVDTSAPKIIGFYLYSNNLDRDILYELAKSNNLWEQRIAVLSTLYFIKNNEFKDTLKIAEILINHPHDLMHKAIGWMLREVGKKDKQVELDFLNKYCRKMPRTMLRYAIEKFNEEERKIFLNNK